VTTRGYQCPDFPPVFLYPGAKFSRGLVAVRAYWERVIFERFSHRFFPPCVLLTGRQFLPDLWAHTYTALKGEGRPSSFFCV